MKRSDITPEKREEIRLVLDAVREALCTFWDRQLDVERLIDQEVPDMRQYVEDAAAADGEVDDEIVDWFIEEELES